MEDRGERVGGVAGPTSRRVGMEGGFRASLRDGSSCRGDRGLKATSTFAISLREAGGAWTAKGSKERDGAIETDACGATEDDQRARRFSRMARAFRPIPRLV